MEAHLDVEAPRCRREILICFLLPWLLAVESKPSLVLLLTCPSCLPLCPFLPFWGDSAYWTHCVYFFLHFCHHGSNSSWNLIFFLVYFCYVFSIGNWVWQCATELGWCGVRHSPCLSGGPWWWISWRTGSGRCQAISRGSANSILMAESGIQGMPTALQKTGDDNFPP